MIGIRQNGQHEHGNLHRTSLVEYSKSEQTRE